MPRFAPLLAVAVLAACTRDPDPPPPSPSSPDNGEEQVPQTTIEDRPCLPLVNGCGCAYQCAWGHEVNAAGRWMVSHDYQDSRLDETDRERWCFDAAGRGSPERAAGPGETHCMEVFFDRTPCGGECIPEPAFLSCRVENGGCRRVPQ